MSSKGGAYYLLSIINFVKKVWICFLKQKSNMLDIFKKLKTMTQKQAGKHLKCVHTYSGLEFYCNEFNSFCKSKGILMHYRQNDVIEWMNKTLIEKFRCMLSNVGLPKTFVPKATSQLVLLLTPHSQLLLVKWYQKRYGLHLSLVTQIKNI